MMARSPDVPPPRQPRTAEWQTPMSRASGSSAVGAEEAQRLAVEAEREGGVPIGAEVQEHRVLSARAIDDLALDELELAGEAAGVLGAADREERIRPKPAALGSRLALECQHLRRRGAIVGEGIDAREAAPDELALDPEPVVPRESWASTRP